MIVIEALSLSLSLLVCCSLTLSPLLFLSGFGIVLAISSTFLFPKCPVQLLSRMFSSKNWHGLLSTASSWFRQQSPHLSSLSVASL